MEKKCLSNMLGQQKTSGQLEYSLALIVQVSHLCVFFFLALQEKAKPVSQHMFEARGPGGCLLLIEILTDNNSRSHQEIKRLLNKNGSGWAWYNLSLL